ncbi:MGDG synthase family glycosyltransferase [Paenibacillus aceris]|uniref:Processive 1,2-diacylglycerol beta-glucosyltransferase n=1 Tax=Paenibacillus aceris TaxID=869555 RepID=A0ABS4I6S1_9BACL|nr:glycosyltransferase [Paenibacillus aceris]MBP1966599.1 processive 1,2-diacylglycerol beta-glucosyltransferase [Paenibacillus aceris]NHW38836.1 glycosyltransferase [Paenibacillus aceris]
MSVNPRVLILTANYGNGHIQASKALQQQFLKQGVEHVKVVDLMKEGHPLINLITTSLVNQSTKSSRIGLDYYGWSYYLTRESKRTALFQRSMNYLGKKKLRELIHKERPNVVVNTFPFGASPEVCSSLNIMNFTVLTDYALHATWLHPNVDKYYVATEELKQQIIFRGFNKERVEVSGIPVRQEFTREKSIPRHKKNIILIMASDRGVNSYMEEMLNSLAALDHCQLVVVCGRNEKLLLRLRDQFAAVKGVTILGFVDNVHEWMSQATCIVTKAGGLTLTEAIVQQLPIFIYKPYGGQEKENALYLSSRGVASISIHLEELANQINRLIRNPGLHQVIEERMKAMHRSQAAEHIVSDMMLTMNNQSFSLSI